MRVVNAPFARRSRPAFTLVELLVGVLITALIAGATAVALSQLVRARTSAQARQQAWFRADSAAARIALDLMAAVRDEDLYFTRVAIADGAGGGSDELLLVTRAMRRVRGFPEAPEGPDFEVQYRVMEASTGPALWRRVDPALDQYPDAGGVASVAVTGLVALSIAASDGEEWLTSWDSDFDGLPYGLRIEVTARDDAGRTTATARRIVALDRTPSPLEPLDEAESTENAGSAPAAGGGR